MDGVTGIFLPQCLFCSMVACEDPSMLAVSADREISRRWVLFDPRMYILRSRLMGKSSECNVGFGGDIVGTIRLVSSVKSARDSRALGLVTTGYVLLLREVDRMSHRFSHNEGMND